MTWHDMTCGVQVTAPVRETASQTLGMTLTPLTQPSVMAVLTVLAKLQGQSEWDVRCAWGGWVGVWLQQQSCL